MIDTSSSAVTTMEQLEKQNKVVSLFQFIGELNKLRRKTILNMRDHLWYQTVSNLPEDPDHVSFFYRDRMEDDDSTALSETDQENVLLSVRKPELDRCPEPGTLLEDWLLPGWNDYNNEAEVKETRIPWLEDPGLEPGDDSDILVFKDDETRITAWESWLLRRQAWAEKQKETVRVLTLFSDLYRLYFELQRESETEEMIVANGILCDKDNSQIWHPVLTHRVKLDYDPIENTVYVLDTEAAPELYSTVLRAMDGINISVVSGINDALQEHDYHPLDRIETPIFLQSLVHQLLPDSLYSDRGIPSGWKAMNRVLLYLEPCFIVRKRLDGAQKAIEQIIENVQETGEIPEPIAEIVCGGRVEQQEERGELSLAEQLAAVGGESVDILLSKEANKEQLEIARRIEQYNAVLVQGPPGTGKTHTIANLMGHFLAQGKSVLVTSHTSKALSVLKEKVAPGLQNLCVSVLDDSRADMEHSVDGITSYMANTTSHELEGEMQVLAGERKDIIDQLASVRGKIFNIIKQECASIHYRDEEISPSEAAKFVVEHMDDLSYIPGKVRCPAELPLTFEQLVELYRSNEALSAEDEEELATGLPAPETVMGPADFKTTWENLQIAKQNQSLLAAEHGLQADVGNREGKIEIHGSFGAFEMDYPEETAIAALKNYTIDFVKVEDWMKAAAVDGKNGGAYRQRWITLIEQIRRVCIDAEAVVTEQFGVDLQFTDPYDKVVLRGVYQELADVFQTRKPTWIELKLHRAWEEALQTVTVNGKQPQSLQDCTMILHAIDFDAARQKCAGYWDQLLSAHGVPKFMNLDQVHPEHIAEKWIPDILRYLDWYQNDYQPLQRMMNTVGIPTELIFGVTTLDSDLAATGKILSAVERIIPDICDLCTAIMNVDNYTRILRSAKEVFLSGRRGASYVCAAMLQAMETGDPADYAVRYALLETMYEKYELQKNRVDLLTKLEPYAAQWTAAIRQRSGIHGQSVVPEDIEDAWKWKQLCTIIADMIEKPFSTLQAESLRLSQDYRRITAEYAEKSGWYHLLSRTESDIDMKQALQGWVQTVRRIGRGTGKRAPALRAQARRLMVKCQNAVPCWIMTINRALESLSPKNNRFDIVIIDEASQSDIASLAILYMGKKLIIVGDDKQVSPMAVGVKDTDIAALQQEYLVDKIPNAHLYTAQTSIYDIAQTTFQPLMLREHFRCVPEIIGFSNMLSYNGKIKPLRDASSSVLLPAVVNYYVGNGVRDEKKKVNENEAKAIVALMDACIAQPEYNGKSFGVISMLGDDQVRIIQNLIEEQIDPREIVKRQILCGNSANFQGDERDVIFLSVVDSGSPDSILRLQAEGAMDSVRKRYNVAASRARDQLWVVDSLNPATDLQPGDLRKKLIDYSMNPDAFLSLGEQKTGPADSEFESEVASALAQQGYHIMQQCQIGAYCLDMVAVCGRKRVAIECDGERWHNGEANIRADMERQTILERVGWRFIRIRGSEYYCEKEKTLKRVIADLSKCGIEPEHTDIAQENPENPESRTTELLQRVRACAAKKLLDYEESHAEVENSAENTGSLENITASEVMPAGESFEFKEAGEST